MKVVKRLITEFKIMHKPTPKELFRDTIRIGGSAVAAALVIKLVDTGFGALLGLFV